MDETYLYQKIAETIRQEILIGNLKPGDRLLPVREMSVQWGCTIGTVQRAYQDLARQGLVTSRAGQGTHVVERLPIAADTPLRRAALIHRAEAFLLEVLTAGYNISDVETAVRQALDRWRVVEQELGIPDDENSLYFAGSHDLIVTWMASNFPQIAPGFSLQLHFTGSLGGLIALAEGKADLAGSHLWDQDSNTYNVPFVRRFFPGKQMALINLAHRRIGLILPTGNPLDISSLKDLIRPGLRFVNRQSGSGTRVWLDAALQKAGIATGSINGYLDEKMTHTAVARAIAEGQAEAGLGLEAAALSYGLDFVALNLDRYDLVIPAPNLEKPAVEKLTTWLNEPDTHDLIDNLGGYDARQTGQLVWA